MLHFFPHYTADASNTPFGAELARLQVPHRFLGAPISLRYQTKLGLLFGVYPRLAWFALRSAFRSLLLSRPRPTAAIVATDVEALVFGIARRLLRRPTLIIFETLIISPRRSPLSRALRRHYYGLILSIVDVAVCHSSIEVDQYRREFPAARCRFVFIPYGTTMTDRQTLISTYAASGGRDGAIVAAGRSGRDYHTLAEAVRGLPCALLIICDTQAPVAGIPVTEQITVAANCFDHDYWQALARALFVVVPLSVDDISAGQMVLLQASALGKAVIISRTTTTAEYATDGQDALFVDVGDVAGMRAAIRRLLDDADLRAELGRNAALRFEREHSTEAYVRKLVAAIEAAGRR